MLKSVLVAAAAVAIAGSSLVYAQQDHGRAGEGAQRSQRWQPPSAEDMAAFADARIAALQAGLELTPDQKKSWPAFEEALRTLAELRIQERLTDEAARAQMQAGQTALSPFGRLARRADYMAKKSVALKRLAEAGAPLYQSLTDAQKHRFMPLARLLRPHHHYMHARTDIDERSWREGRGYDDGAGSWHRQQGKQLGENGSSGSKQDSMTVPQGDSEL